MIIHHIPSCYRNVDNRKKQTPTLVEEGSSLRRSLTLFAESCKVTEVTEPKPLLSTRDIRIRMWNVRTGQDMKDHESNNENEEIQPRLNLSSEEEDVQNQWEKIGETITTTCQEVMSTISGREWANDLWKRKWIGHTLWKPNASNTRHGPDMEPPRHKKERPAQEHMAQGDLETSGRMDCRGEESPGQKTLVDCGGQPMLHEQGRNRLK